MRLRETTMNRQNDILSIRYTPHLKTSAHILLYLVSETGNQRKPGTKTGTCPGARPGIAGLEAAAAWEGARDQSPSPGPGSGARFGRRPSRAQEAAMLYTRTGSSGSGFGSRPGRQGRDILDPATRPEAGMMAEHHQFQDATICRCMSQA